MGKGLSAEPTEISGMSKNYPGAVIRTGCYLITEMVEDELIVVAGSEHMLTLDVRGAMPGFKLPPVWPIADWGKTTQIYKNKEGFLLKQDSKL